MIEAVRFPVAREGTGYAFQEIGRRHGEFAVVDCAAIVNARRLAVGAVANRPTARDLPLPDDPTLDDALEVFAAEPEPRDDIHAIA